MKKLSILSLTVAFSLIAGSAIAQISGRNFSETENQDLPSPTETRQATVQKTRGGNLNQCLVGSGFLGTLDATQCSIAPEDFNRDGVRSQRPSRLQNTTRGASRVVSEPSDLETTPPIATVQKTRGGNLNQCQVGSGFLGTLDATQCTVAPENFNPGGVRAGQ
jgi:hypothetical protein